METSEKKNKRITIYDYEKVVINGVDHIIGFDEKYVSLLTNHGKIIIEGKKLKIDSLTKETGEIQVCGEFLGIYLSEEKKTTNTLKSIFKWFL